MKKFGLLLITAAFVFGSGFLKKSEDGTIASSGQSGGSSGLSSAQVREMISKEHAKAKGYALEIFYTNIEGEAINRIYQAADSGVDGLVMNPAGFSYAGYALRDCIKGTGLPYVEVHISNVKRRGISSVLASAAEGVVFGFGMYSYTLTLHKNSG